MPSPPNDPRDPASQPDPQDPVRQPAYEPPDLERPATVTPTEAQLQATLPSERSDRHDAYAAFRHREYRLYAIGGFLGSIPGQMQSVAVGWEVYELIRAVYSGEKGVQQGAMALGYVALIQALPVIFLALHAGQVADRHDRKKIILLAQVFLVFAALGLAACSFYRAPVVYFYACLLLAGIAHTYESPARSAMLPQLVPSEILSNAIRWNSSRGQAASMIGLSLGGAAISLFHGATCIYVINAFGICLNALFISQLRSHKPEHSTESPSLETLLAGVRFVWRTKLILATITLDLFAVLFGGAITLLPVYAKDVLHVTPTGLGWLRAAPGVGALIMAVSLAHMPPMRQAGKTLIWAVGGFGIATIIFGISRNFYLSLAMLALTGALDNISVVVRHTLVQVLTPNHMLGRVSAVNSVFIGASNEIGGFESGLVARFFGPIVSVVSGGIGTVLTVLGVAAIWPQVRTLGSLEDAKPEETTEFGERPRPATSVAGS